jgi:hypothetical protein
MLGSSSDSRTLIQGARVWILNRGKSSNPFGQDSRALAPPKSKAYFEPEPFLLMASRESIDSDGQVSLLKCDRIHDRERFRVLLSGAVDPPPGEYAWDGVVDFVCFGRSAPSPSCALDEPY